jgi:hypothetical protein
MGNSGLYLIAILIGSVYLLRKADVGRHQAKSFPHVTEADFELWRSRELAAYNLISIACLVMIVADVCWRLYFERGGVAPGVIQAVGFGIFLAWVVCVAIGIVRARAARKLRARLGIDLNAPA